MISLNISGTAVQIVSLIIGHTGFLVGATPGRDGDSLPEGVVPEQYRVLPSWWKVVSMTEQVFPSF